MLGSDFQESYYARGDVRSNSTSRTESNTVVGHFEDFRNAFRHFLLNFSLNGEYVYRDQIRNLHLHHSRKGRDDAIQEASSKNIPSLRLDLEFLNMTHWLPRAQLDNDAAVTSNYLDSENLSQVSEEVTIAHPTTAAAVVSSSSYRWGEILVQAFRDQPLQYLSIAEEIVREVYIELLSAVEQKSALEVADNLLGQAGHLETKQLGLFQIELVCRSKITSLRELGAASIESLVILTGIVIQSYKPQHKAIRVKIRCRQCESTMRLAIPAWKEAIELPRFCAQSASKRLDERCPIDPYYILSDESEFCDTQAIKLQELPEHVPTGDMPRSIVLNAANALCGRVVPGERIIVVGVYTAFNKGGGAGSKISDGVRSSYIHVLGLDYCDASGSRSDAAWTFRQEEEFQALARDPKIQEKIFDSVAPSLIGCEDIKKSVACLLFGGSRKSLRDGTKLRGDINILLLGDPSTAKSQFLKFVEKAAPISVYTSGKGSSAAGLTAAVIRDANGNFALEGGAMVLADGGVVCIDEFDKMRDNDRVAIHEAMEQQTISMAKAGITTVLTTRCSVLAAANPTFGSYDESRETTDQHDFETTILSRFDLIWLVRDEKNVEKDQIIAKHVYELHSGGGVAAESQVPISTAKLKDYINYARSTCSPILSDEAAKKLENFYVEVRDSARSDSRKKKDQIPITIRQLESLARVAESLAKMSLSRFVTESHVEEATRLFKLSTIEAAKSSLARDVLTEAERLRVKAAESIILSRLPINARASKSSVLREMRSRGFEAVVTGRALRALIQRGLLEERGDASIRRLG